MCISTKQHSNEDFALHSTPERNIPLFPSFPGRRFDSHYNATSSISVVASACVVPVTSVSKTLKRHESISLHFLNDLIKDSVMFCIGSGQYQFDVRFPQSMIMSLGNVGKLLSKIIRSKTI